MSLAVKFTPASRIAVLVALVYCHCAAGTSTGVSSRCTRCVSLACAGSLLPEAAAYVRANVPAEPLVTMYSYAGPVIVVSAGPGLCFAMGSLRVAVVVLAGSGLRSSQPLQTVA